MAKYLMLLLQLYNLKLQCVEIWSFSHCQVEKEDCKIA